VASITNPKEKIVSFQKSISVRIALLSLLMLSVPFMAAGQRAEPTPTLVVERAKPAMSIAGWNNLYCAGFIQKGAISTANRIIGGQDEADQYNYSQNDFVYINRGNSKGASVGDIFAVVRPRGEFNSKWSRKNDLGFYVQEVGALEVGDVKPDVAVARVRTSCDSFLLGDLVQMVPARTSPRAEPQPAFDRFGDASGKATGRVLMARDNQEMITRDQIAYVDLGADDNVSVGDRLTVFRPLEKGNLFNMPDREGVTSRDYGFHSQVYNGGRFSNQSSRKGGEKADGKEQTTARAKKGRPFLRKVVGEAVVLNVKERTATVVITRTAQEIHTGDWVEIR